MIHLERNDRMMKVKRPKTIPSVMLPVTGMSRMVMNAGMVSTGSDSLMWRTTPNR